MDAFVQISGDEWLKATLSIRNRAFSAQMEVGGRVIVITGNAVGAGTRKAAQLARDNPIPAALLVAGLVVLLYVYRESPLLVQLRDDLAKSATTALTEISQRTSGRPQAAAAAAVTVEAHSPARWVGPAGGAGRPCPHHWAAGRAHGHRLAGHHRPQVRGAAHPRPLSGLRRGLGRALASRRGHGDATRIIGRSRGRQGRTDASSSPA